MIPELILAAALSGLGQHLADIKSKAAAKHQGSIKRERVREAQLIKQGMSPVLVEPKSLPAPAKTIQLAWDYAANDPINNQPNVVFEVQKASAPLSNIWSFSFCTNAPSTYFIGSADGEMGFFRVRSSNIVTHLVSGWATK